LSTLITHLSGPYYILVANLSGLMFSITHSTHLSYCLRITVIELSPYHSCLHCFGKTPPEMCGSLNF